MLDDVRELISYEITKWKLGGSSVEEGFDSPSFASYLVNKYSFFKSSICPFTSKYPLKKDAITD